MLLLDPYDILFHFIVFIPVSYWHWRVIVCWKVGGKVKVVKLPGRIGMALHCNCLNLLMVGLNSFIYLTNSWCICLQGGRFFSGWPPKPKDWSFSGNQWSAVEKNKQTIKWEKAKSCPHKECNHRQWIMTRHFGTTLYSSTIIAQLLSYDDNACKLGWLALPWGSS